MSVSCLYCMLNITGCLVHFCIIVMLYDYNSCVCIAIMSTILHCRTKQESYYVGDFIVKDADVDQHLATLGYMSGTVSNCYLISVKVSCV